MRLAQSYHAAAGLGPATARFHACEWVNGLKKGKPAPPPGRPPKGSAGRNCSVELVSYDVANVVARGKVARNGLLYAALAGVGNAHLYRAAASAWLAESIMPRQARSRDAGSIHSRLAAIAAKHPAHHGSS